MDQEYSLQLDDDCWREVVQELGVDQDGDSNISFDGCVNGSILLANFWSRCAYCIVCRTLKLYGCSLPVINVEIQTSAPKVRNRSLKI